MQRNTEVGLFTQSSYFNPINRSPDAGEGYRCFTVEEHLYIEWFIYYKKRKMERNFSRT